MADIKSDDGRPVIIKAGDDRPIIIKAGDLVIKGGDAGEGHAGAPVTIIGGSYKAGDGRAVIVSNEQVSAGDAKPPKEPPPKEYLLSWREILNALDRKNDKECRDQMRGINDKYDGPIIFPGQGSQPKVDRQHLLDWWNRLEIMWQDQANQARGSLAEAETQHDYGRTGIAVPEISGGVKQRREDRAQ